MTQNLLRLILLMLVIAAARAEDYSLAAAEAAWQRGDAETARLHWQALAEQGDVLAINNLGHLYENGIGVERDFKKSFELYQRAADAGVAVAQFNLGEAYYNGHGPPVDKIEALKWYMLAANGRDPDADAAVQRLQLTLSFEEQGEAALRMMQWRREHAKPRR